ncbi:MAG: tRNA (adenosine(37)-N6)-threonylcarbamoyltransferase complex dimerization subunit type 1 TsaB [Proteobacteria bacterium]|nr:tRNA (adenosine(37)-N6)-threonylcarbamoyltransferase complex dimerization subunit type 1 TsaB [Pseudomonadota bacterium]MBU1584290.1 tRNA (adenosine(37)-N6)-threonylcarbamoyltransferase complex dimerization subunit type 1 TsaB [Pseudomonadota bacterium]MBU2455330.1 tRNA (adenosine(37)-N6)-threonylcarbamoyltransferase complex dimerization subunit type 1 TsaB [Pseudomonadota bacterium]MBU2628173.1 tRNA (adenosine(37)-N6)-threonylcarbamoyltransferase complex dimerization subunit type 1 TsaB [Pse
MKLLSLSTAEQGCSLAITDDKALVCEEFWNAKLTHSKRLVKMIEHLLEKRAGIKLDDMDGFVAAKGPGSFTGLRIGISVIKGLAYAMEKPAAGVSSLDGIAFRFVHSSVPVCVMMDARRNEVYCAVYQFDQGRLVSKSQERVVSPQEAIGMTKGSVLFAGSGSKAYKPIIEQTACRPLIAHDFLDSVSATALILSLCSKENFLNQPDNILTPSYIRKSDAQLQFAEKQGY